MVMLRGYEIYQKENGEWYFSDTNEPTVATWKHRRCGHCNLADTPEGYDGCIGYPAGVMNACGGHGEPETAYVQFIDRSTIHGCEARCYQEIERKLCVSGEPM